MRVEGGLVASHHNNWKSCAKMTYPWFPLLRELDSKNCQWKGLLPTGNSNCWCHPLLWNCIYMTMPGWIQAWGWGEVLRSKYSASALIWTNNFISSCFGENIWTGRVQWFRIKSENSQYLGVALKSHLGWFICQFKDEQKVPVSKS